MTEIEIAAAIEKLAVGQTLLANNCKWLQYQKNNNSLIFTFFLQEIEKEKPVDLDDVKEFLTKYPIQQYGFMPLEHCAPKYYLGLQKKANKYFVVGWYKDKENATRAFATLVEQCKKIGDKDTVRLATVKEDVIKEYIGTDSKSFEPELTNVYGVFLGGASKHKEALLKIVKKSNTGNNVDCIEVQGERECKMYLDLLGLNVNEKGNNIWKYYSLGTNDCLFINKANCLSKESAYMISSLIIDALSADELEAFCKANDIFWAKPALDVCLGIYARTALANFLRDCPNANAGNACECRLPHNETWKPNRYAVQKIKACDDYIIEPDNMFAVVELASSKYERGDIILRWPCIMKIVGKCE